MLYLFRKHSQKYFLSTLIISLFLNFPLTTQNTYAKTADVEEIQHKDSHSKMANKDVGGIFRRLIRDLLGGEEPERTVPTNTDEGDGGSHDRCPVSPSGIPLSAIMPVGNFSVPPEYSKTISPHPTFWFYVPYSESAPLETDRRMEFVLLDESEQIVYEGIFPLPANISGIVQFQIPQKVSLMPGHRYRWVFSIMCNPLNRSGDETVNGWLELVENHDEILNELSKYSTEEQLEGYITQGFWFETVDALARLVQSTHPPDPALQETWKVLVVEFGLPEKLSAESFVPCWASTMCLETTSTRPGT